MRGRMVTSYKISRCRATRLGGLHVITGAARDRAAATINDFCRMFGPQINRTRLPIIHHELRFVKIIRCLQKDLQCMFRQSMNGNSGAGCFRLVELRSFEDSAPATHPCSKSKQSTRFRMRVECSNADSRHRSISISRDVERFHAKLSGGSEIAPESQRQQDQRAGRDGSFDEDI